MKAIIDHIDVVLVWLQSIASPEFINGISIEVAGGIILAIISIPFWFLKRRIGAYKRKPTIEAEMEIHHTEYTRDKDGNVASKELRLKSA